MSSISRDEWLSALAEVGHSSEDDQDALTVAEFGEMFQLKRSAAISRLKQLVAAGRATRTYKWVTAPDGRRLHNVAYRLITAKKAKRSV